MPFGVNWETDVQCFWGNELKPAEMQKAPRFDIPTSDNVWTVVVTSLDRLSPELCPMDTVHRVERVRF